MCFCNQYLKNTASGYYILLLGKNGEPKKDIKMKFTLQHKYLEKAFEFELDTGEKGQISLGKL